MEHAQSSNLFILLPFSIYQKSMTTTTLASIGPDFLESLSLVKKSQLLFYVYGFFFQLHSWDIFKLFIVLMYYLFDILDNVSRVTFISPFYYELLQICITINLLWIFLFMTFNGQM